MCKIVGKVKGVNIVMNTIGYRGAKEAKTPLADLRQARMFVVPKAEARKAGLKVGTTVTVKLGNAKIRGTVKPWSRGSKVIIPKEQYPFKKYSTRTLSKYLID